MKHHDFVMTKDVIQQLLPSNSAKEHSMNYLFHFQTLKVPLTHKIYISVNEAVPGVKTTGDTKSRYT